MTDIENEQLTERFYFETCKMKNKDMTSIYRGIADNDFEKNLNPILLYRLPRKSPVVCITSSDKATKTIVISDALPEDRIIELYREASGTDIYDVNCEDAGGMVVGFEHAAEIYREMLMHSNILGVSCPQIIFADRDLMGNSSGLASARPGLANVVLIDTSLSYVSQIQVLAHEMRHVYQAYRMPALFQGCNSIYAKGKKADSKFWLQPAEIDAEAYSWRYMSDIYGVDIEIDFGDPRIKNAMLQRKEKFHDLGKALFKRNKELFLISAFSSTFHNIVASVGC